MLRRLGVIGFCAERLGDGSEFKSLNALTVLHLYSFYKNIAAHDYLNSELVTTLTGPLMNGKVLAGQMIKVLEIISNLAELGTAFASTFYNDQLIEFLLSIIGDQFWERAIIKEAAKALKSLTADMNQAMLYKFAVCEVTADRLLKSVQESNLETTLLCLEVIENLLQAEAKICTRRDEAGIKNQFIQCNQLKVLRELDEEQNSLIRNKACHIRESFFGNVEWDFIS